MLDHIVYRARNPFSLPDAFPSKENRQFKRALKGLDAAVSRIIHRQRDKVLATPTDENEPANVISMLLRAKDDHSGVSMSEKQIRDEIITLLIAGHETVASALTWSIYLLSRAPEVQAKSHQETGHSLAMRNPSQPQHFSLPLAQQIFAEALRLYPPAWIITRRAVNPDIIALQHPFHIPAGALVVISPYLIHRHPGYWEAPDTFRPERFSEGAEKLQHRFAYIPFGGGPRLCIGEGMARLEGQLILSLLTQRFTFSSPDQPEILLDPAVTLRPKHGLSVRVSPLSISSDLRISHDQ